MGKYKDEGNPSLALAEECSEVIKVIMKKHRFDQSWDSNPPSSTQTRWEELESEMNDLIYQWDRLKFHMRKYFKLKIKIDRIAEFFNLLDSGEKVTVEYKFIEEGIQYYEINLPMHLKTESFYDSVDELIFQY